MRAVFPTRVGVNRGVEMDGIVRVRVPHASGGEPIEIVSPISETNVFPTRVGVNRFAGSLNEMDCCVPHASGGEPVVNNPGTAHSECSPREWG